MSVRLKGLKSWKSFVPATTKSDLLEEEDGKASQKRDANKNQKLLSVRMCGLHVERAGRVCPAEVRHATVDGKIPLKHLQNNSAASPSFLFHTIFDLYKPRLHCSWFIFLYLRLYGTTLVLTLTLFTKIGFRGCFFTKGSTSIHVLFFFRVLFSSQKPQWEEKRGRELQWEEVWKEEPLLDCVFISLLSSYNVGWITLHISCLIPHLVFWGNGNKGREVWCCSETSWWVLWLEMIEWHPWATFCIQWSGPHLSPPHLSKWPLVCLQLLITTLDPRWWREWMEGKEEGEWVSMSGIIKSRRCKRMSVENSTCKTGLPESRTFLGCKTRI